MIIPEILEQRFLGSSVQAWLVAGGTSVVVAAIGLLLRHVLVSRLGALAERTTNKVDDLVVELIRQTRTWVIVAFALFAGTAQVAWRYSSIVGHASRLVLLWQIAVWGVAAVSFWVSQQLEHRTGTHERTSIAMISAVGVGAKVLVWILISLTALSIFGVNVATLVTGLGVSGIAVALAVQNILGDLLAALSIVFDKPFDVGDTIGVDSITGVVEHIGLKTTRLRSQSGEQIVIGNADLLKSRIRNFRRMYQRRVVLNLDMPFDTPPEVLARIPSMLEGIVGAQQPVKFDRSHVANFTESAVRIETVYFVLDADYKIYMNVQQAINLEIIRRFNTEQLRFALPSRTVYHEGAPPKTQLD